MFTLAHRVMAGHDEADYVLTDGERICSTADRVELRDGHMHNEQLIAALQKRCPLRAGEVRVLLLDAQPIHRQVRSTGWSTPRRVCSSGGTSWSPT